VGAANNQLSIINYQFGGLIMASVAQIQANRLNAQKSTGPRTAAGKERASRNALRHGLLAREAVIAGEDPEEFEIYREGMLAELAPAGMVETMLAERVVGLAWRLRRAERLQNMAFAALDEGEPTELLEARLEEWKQHKGNEWERGLAGVLHENAALGQVVVADFAEARVLDRLLMYERRIESSLYRTMAVLRHERQARAAAATPEEVSRSEGRLPAGQESSTAAELGSFGANVAPQSPARKTAFGSPEPPPAVAANPPAAGPDHDSGVPSFHPSSAVADVPVEEELCETNPISPGLSSWTCQGTSGEPEGAGDVRPPSAGHTQIPI
jgi:hypothetical protein